MNTIREIRCHSADDFLKHLLPTHPFWQEMQQKWIFRGQADANWKLIPTLFRKSSWENFKLIDPLQLTVRELIKNEYWIIRTFLDACDSAGLTVPEDSQIIRCGYLNHKANQFDVAQIKNFGRNWPPDVIMSIIAIAQHHGIPTRLLDWTRSALIASYFASKEGVKESRKKDQNIVVFALNSESLHHDVAGWTKPEGIYLISAPYGQNRNLSAQKGVFTLLRTVPDLDAAVNVTALEDLVSLKADTLLVRFTLPVNCCAELLRKLKDFGISAGSLFPDVSGSVEACRERMLWDK